MLFHLLESMEGNYATASHCEGPPDTHTHTHQPSHSFYEVFTQMCVYGRTTGVNSSASRAKPHRVRVIVHTCTPRQSEPFHLTPALSSPRAGILSALPGTEG